MKEPERMQKYLPLFRACAGWTSQDLARRLEVSRQTISAWENYDARRPNKGVRMTAMQYLAVRKLLDDEISRDLAEGGTGKEQHMIGTLLEILVDHPERYTEEDVRVVIDQAKLLAPSIMKQPEQRKSVSKVWPLLIAGCGIALSAAFAAILGLGHDKK